MRLIKSVLVYLFLCSVTSVEAHIFEASGVGNTPKEARQDAITNAVKLGVGELIISKEELNNEEFNQKIVSHSNAYINSVNVKSQMKLPNGSYEVEVEVDIENDKLLDQLQEMQIAVSENVIDNEALLKTMNHFEKKDSYKKSLEEFDELVDTLLVSPVLEN